MPFQTIPQKRTQLEIPSVQQKIKTNSLNAIPNHSVEEKPTHSKTKQPKILKIVSVQVRVIVQSGGLESRGPPSDAQAASAQAEVPGPPPSSDCAETTCNKLLKISNFQNTKPHEKPQNYRRKSKYITQKSYRRHPTAKKN
jgi:hypothetical protein